MIITAFREFPKAERTMEETKYRESRLCRLLGNPMVYRMVVLLAEKGPLAPSSIAEMTGRSIQTVSGHLAKLRTADVVRYETAGGKTQYWLKNPQEMEGVIQALERAVTASTRLK